MFDSSYAATEMLWLYYVIAAVVNTQQPRSLFIVSLHYITGFCNQIHPFGLLIKNSDPYYHAVAITIFI